jgi:hypothetical protein
MVALALPRGTPGTVHTVLSVLQGEHSVGDGIFGFFSMKEACTLRLVCDEFRKSITDARWHDEKTKIKGSLASWRESFPNARAANISLRQDLVDSDFAYLRGIHVLDMSGCTRSIITNNAFSHLHDIHTLNMKFCFQKSITNAAFAHLRGIHTLDMTWCRQITDAAFVHLRGIHTLIMKNCNITDAAIVHLRGIHTLNIIGCTNITDAAFVNLSGIHTLNMRNCVLITNTGFAHLHGIQKIYLSDTYKDDILPQHISSKRVIKDDTPLEDKLRRSMKAYINKQEKRVLELQRVRHQLLRLQSKVEYRLMSGTAEKKD